jgi:DNA ligase-1
VSAPALLLAERWDGATDPTGWWLSEKLDGVRAYWDGRHFLSRQGNLYHAPDWFVAGLPNVPLDGELWLDRKMFQRAVSIVRRQDQSDLWKQISYLVFDAPAIEKGFEARLEFVRDCLREGQPKYARPHEHAVCTGVDHLRQELARLEALGAEGLMLRRAGSRYEAGRSATLLKVKTFHDAEARVLKHDEGAGRHQGRLGALLVELLNGTTFSVGTGFSDAERDNPPPVGSLITFRYQELSDAGVPRFPTYVGLHADALREPAPSRPIQGDLPMMTGNVQATRRFEFSGGNSNKFWEITVQGTEATVRFGRIGTTGQASVKSFADREAAQRHAGKLIQQKLGKGYHEVK